MRLQMVTDDLTMKARVEQVLNETGNTENRAAKMDVDDILKYDNELDCQMPTDISSRLLSAFHDIGVHFA